MESGTVVEGFGLLEGCIPGIDWMTDFNLLLLVPKCTEMIFDTW